MAEIVAELVCEHSAAAVFRLDRVVTDPEICAREVVATEVTAGGPAVGIVVGIPTMAPNRIAALRASPFSVASTTR
jgi:hypothetical protein